MKKQNQVNTRKKGSLFTAVAIVAATVLGVALLCSIALIVKSRSKVTAKSENLASEEMMSDLEDIQIYLSTLEKTVTDNKSTLENIKEESGGKSTELINHQTETISSLTGEVKSLYEEIVGTKDDVSHLISLLNGDGEATKESIELNYAEIKSALEGINESYDHTLGSLESMIAAISGKNDENYQAILKGLTGVESNMKSQSKESLDNMMASLKTMESGYEKTMASFEDEVGKGLLGLNDKLQIIDGSIDSKFDGIRSAMDSRIDTLDSSVEEKMNTLNSSVEGKMNTLNSSVEEKMNTLNSSVEEKMTTLNSSVEEKMTTLNSSVEEKFNTLNATVENQFTTFNTTINSDNTELVSTINSLFGDVNTRLSEVFQFASSGKGLLASTLTGYPEQYRVETSTDASFNTIKTNTDIAIERAIAYGQSLTESNNKVLLVPEGCSVTIRAHFHDLNQEGCEKEFASVDEYLAYKASRGDTSISTDEGGCYSQAHTYSHAIGTHGSWCDCKSTHSNKITAKRVDWVADPYWSDWCGQCGHFCGPNAIIVTDYESGIDYYNTGCGYYDGEILSIDVRRE